MIREMILNQPGRLHEISWARTSIGSAKENLSEIDTIIGAKCSQNMANFGFNDWRRDTGFVTL